MRGRRIGLGALLFLPMAGFALLIAAPSFDLEWEHRPSHFGDQSDHELRAARAAVGIRERTERLRAGRDDWPRFRVGLNTGPAVVGTVGAGDQRSFAAIGDTTNVAARLQSLAQPGQILVGPITFEKIADRAALEPLGAVELKGKSLPIDAHLLVSMNAEAR